MWNAFRAFSGQARQRFNSVPLRGLAAVGLPVAAASSLPAPASESCGDDSEYENTGRFGDPARRCTDVLLVTNVAAYALQLFSRHSLTNWGQLCGKHIAAGQYRRLLTSVFLHASPMHLAGNSFALHWLGPDLEHTAGHGRFAATYLLSGLSGSLLGLALERTKAVGASGAIYGVIAANMVNSYRNFGQSRPTEVELYMLFVAYAALFHPRVSNWGHLGGLLGGATSAYLLGPRLVYRRVPGRPELVEAVDEPPLPLLRG